MKIWEITNEMATGGATTAGAIATAPAGEPYGVGIIKRNPTKKKKKKRTKK